MAFQLVLVVILDIPSSRKAEPPKDVPFGVGHASNERRKAAAFRENQPERIITGLCDASTSQLEIWKTKVGK